MNPSLPNAPAIPPMSSLPPPPGSTRYVYSERLRVACRENWEVRRPETPRRCEGCKSGGILLQLMYKPKHAGEWAAMCKNCSNFWYPKQIPPSPQLRARIEAIRADDERLAAEQRLTTLANAPSQRSPRQSGAPTPHREPPAATLGGSTTQNPAPPNLGVHTREVPAHAHESAQPAHPENQPNLDTRPSAQHTVRQVSSIRPTDERERRVRLVIWPQSDDRAQVFTVKAPYGVFVLTNHRDVLDALALRDGDQWDRWVPSASEWEPNLPLGKKVRLQVADRSILVRLQGVARCVGLGAELEKLESDVKAIHLPSDDRPQKQDEAIDFAKQRYSPERVLKRRHAGHENAEAGGSGLSNEAKEDLEKVSRQRLNEGVEHQGGSRVDIQRRYSPPHMKGCRGASTDTILISDSD